MRLFFLYLQVNATKRDAFFRTGGDGPTTKFDPTNRYAGHDRDRLIKKEENHISPSEMEKEKEKERERKYGAETRKELEGYVGFANLPNQVYRKSVKRGFEFTLMVVGEAGYFVFFKQLGRMLFSCQYQNHPCTMNHLVQSVEICLLERREEGERGR